MNKLYPWQEEPWQRWVGLRSRLPHAILLKGAQGIGKFDFAMNIAASLLCEEPLADGLACQVCPSCHWFQQDTHPDFRLLQPDVLAETESSEEREAGKKKPSRQISVDQIRALTDFTNLSAHRGGHRVVLIHPAEAMNSNAANALLKTLEEPPANMLIILVSHKPQQLLPTILSRCMALTMPMPTHEASTVWLKQQGINNPLAVLTQAGFAPLQAVRLTEEAASTDEYNRFLQEIKQPSEFDVFALAEQLQKTEPVKVIHWLQQWCYDLCSAKLTGKIRYNLELTDYINILSVKVSLLQLQRYQKELVVARREALHPLNPKLQFEAILLSYRQMTMSNN
ncbi:MAG: DNA polymerase III subunit delta' [Nitrosomonadales bacterium]